MQARVRPFKPGLLRAHAAGAVRGMKRTATASRHAQRDQVMPHPAQVGLSDRFRDVIAPVITKAIGSEPGPEWRRETNDQRTLDASSCRSIRFARSTLCT